MTPTLPSTFQRKCRATWCFVVIRSPRLSVGRSPRDVLLELAQELRQLFLSSNRHAIEQCDHPLFVLPRHAAELLPAGGGELDSEGPAVFGVGHARHEAFFFQHVRD